MLTYCAIVAEGVAFVAFGEGLMLPEAEETGDADALAVGTASGVTDGTGVFVSVFTCDSSTGKYLPLSHTR